MKLKQEKIVTLKIGIPDTAYVAGTKKVQRRTQTAVIQHHEFTVDILKKYGIPTDGSMVILMPGSKHPFDADDVPYEEIETNMELLVVPNDPAYVGREANPAPHLPSVIARIAEESHKTAVKLGWATEVAVEGDPKSVYPKLLHDPDPSLNKPDKLVHGPEEESEAIADGYTVEIPAPSV